MPSSRVNITFTGAASPYTAGDKASFPMEKARAFVRRGVAIFTNPELQDKATTRVRLNDRPERPHSIRGADTSGHDHKAPVDEFDMALRRSPNDSFDRRPGVKDARGREVLTDKDGNPLDDFYEEPAPAKEPSAEDAPPDPTTRDPVVGTGLGTQESAGHSVNVEAAAARAAEKEAEELAAKEAADKKAAEDAAAEKAAADKAAADAAAAEEVTKTKAKARTRL